MNDGWEATVKEVKSSENLTAPRLEDFWIDFFKALQVAGKVEMN